MSKKLLKCKNFVCEMTSGLIAIIDDEAVIIKYADMLSETTSIVVYVPVSNVQYIASKYMPNMELVTTYVTVDEL